MWPLSERKSYRPVVCSLQINHERDVGYEFILGKLTQMRTILLWAGIHKQKLNPNILESLNFSWDHI